MHPDSLFAWIRSLITMPQMPTPPKVAGLPLPKRNLRLVPGAQTAWDQATAQLQVQVDQWCKQIGEFVFWYGVEKGASYGMVAGVVVGFLLGAGCTVSILKFIAWASDQNDKQNSLYSGHDSGFVRSGNEIRDRQRSDLRERPSDY